MSEPEPLLCLRLQSAKVTYSEGFSVEISGPLWPRELKALSEILEIYKRCTQDTRKGITDDNHVHA